LSYQRVPQAEPPAARLRRSKLSRSNSATLSRKRIRYRDDVQSTEARNEPPLPGRLDRPGVVVLTHVADGFAGVDAVEDGEAPQRRAGSAAASAARDLDALARGPKPRFE